MTDKEIMALHHIKRHNGHGGCDTYPIQGPRYPGWLRVVPAKVWLRRLKSIFMGKAKGEERNEPRISNRSNYSQGA
jgi:hypothetical protein